jgi:hypothetical protein
MVSLDFLPIDDDDSIRGKNAADDVLTSQVFVRSHNCIAEALRYKNFALVKKFFSLLKKSHW